MYFSEMPDRTIYHHVCPDLTAAATPTRRDAWQPRNENLRVPRSSQVPTIISEGLGVECLSKPMHPEPLWITELKVNAAKQEDS
jgi:hypothetical protein